MAASAKHGARETNVRVAIRCRPMSSKETARGCTSIIDFPGPRAIHIRPPPDKQDRGEKDFTFDFSYSQDTTQDLVYSDIGMPIIKQALDGFNCTVFAYGQTGSGKSHSMMGTDTDRGIIPRLNDGLWDSLSNTLSAKSSSSGELKFLVTVSFLEIYNEQIKDLLNPSKKVLELREEVGGRGIYVEDLCELVVHGAQDVLKLIEQGNTVRRVAATKMNDQSSRSHSCFTIKIEQKTTLALDNGKTRETTVKAKLNLVDLAGSERADKTGATGSTLKEGANINKSLMALGNVINALSEGTGGKAAQHIPYRDSKLTRLLQESLGGNASTLMIAAISPADYNYDETMSTLKYAHRAKSIANAVVKNEDASERMITDLKKEIEALRAQLAGQMPVQGDNTRSAGVSRKGPADPELMTRLREMEEQQKNAWEEKERLSKQLDDERQANVNAAISTMMSTMKDEKVLHMKNIKKLTNEKAALSKEYKEAKESTAKLKARLDTSMKSYVELQKEADLPQVRADAAQLDAVSDKLASLLTGIEKDRSDFVRLQTRSKEVKARLAVLEEEITDERAELVSTAGLLEQNDKIRSRIQEEERQAAQVMIAAELEKEREKLQRERETVKGDMQSLEAELARLRKENNDLTVKLSVSERRLVEETQRAEAAKIYSDSLEERIATAEADVESLQAAQHEVARLQQELQSANADGGVKAMSEALREARRRVEELEQQGYSMFSALMDRLSDETHSGAAKLKETQALLGQATRDIIALQRKNEALSLSLRQALSYEPQIFH